jgi:hypothetical protein
MNAERGWIVEPPPPQKEWYESHYSRMADYGHLFPDDLGRIADVFDAAAENAAVWLRTGPSLRAVPWGGDMP